MKRLVLACALALLAPASVARASDTDILIELAALRAANGLPALREAPELSAGCRALMAHRAANGGTVGDRAAWPEAAKRLSWWIDARWWGFGGERPTVEFPNVDAGLVSPAADAIGVGDGCLGFGASRGAWPETAALIPFPGEGTTRTRFEVTAWSEFPEGNLSQRLGGPSTSGPYLRVFAWGGAFARVAPGSVQADVTASLVDQQGAAIPVRSAANGMLATWAQTGTAVVVPSVPLSTRTWYTASVTYRERVSGEAASRTWTFRTMGRQPLTRALIRNNGRVLVSTSSPASVWVTLRRGADRVSLGPFGRGTSSVTLPVAPGEYRICIEQAAVGPYDGTDRCEEVGQSWAAPVTFRAQRRRDGQVEIRASAPASAVGLRLKGRIAAVRVRGRWTPIADGARVAGTFGRRPTAWAVPQAKRLARASAMRLQWMTDSRPTTEGQRWLALPQTTTVEIGRR